MAKIFRHDTGVPGFATPVLRIVLRKIDHPASTFHAPLLSASLLATMRATRRWLT
jgi:hypothetical protein